MGNRLHILIAVFCLTSFVSAEVTIHRITTRGQSVAILDGGWDFNLNSQLEILALLEPADSLAASEIVYYEQSQADTLRVLWRYRLNAETLALFRDARITNLNGDQRPELTALLYYQTLDDGSNPRWLWVFDWDNTTNMFSAEPTTQWNYRGQGISYLRPRQLIAADLNNDGDDELVITTGSPDRMVLIADWSTNGMRALKTFRSREMALGPWPFSVALADFDGDARQDILVIGHGRPRTLPVYLNRRDDFHATSISIPEVEMILPEAIATSDLNNDGQEEVILPHTNGSLTLVNLTGRTLSAAVLDTRIPNLVDLKTVDLDGDGTTEMIYLQADGTITTNDTRFVTPITRAQILSNLPAGLTPPLDYHSLAVIPATEQRPSVLLLAVHTLTGAFIASSEMGEPRPLELALPSLDVTKTVSDMGIITGEAEQVPELEPFAVHEEGTEVYLPAQARAPDPRALPPHRTPDILLYPGDEFARNVLGERTEQFAGFRFLSKAPQMVFNFQRQALVWQPTLEHLGTWNIEYEITYNVGVRPEAMVTESVMVPEKEIVRDQLLIYVNDKPQITSEPESRRILAGQLFAYRIQVEDRNADARIDYRLETGPEGMVIERNGILSWRTNETHHDDYQVVISATDGFDKDVQTFTLNVNAQLTITSAIPHIARVQKPYQYLLEVFQPGTQKAHMFSLPQAPSGMQIDSSGLITWTPTPAQMDTQHFQVQVTDGTAQDTQEGLIYVNAQPKLTQAPPPAVAVVAGDTLRLTFNGRDSNSDQSLEWNLVGGPLNMAIDSAGNLVWPTTSQDLDAAQYIVELSDGVDATPFKGVAFVNAPIRITSLPPDSVMVGLTYRYPIVTRDDNRSTLLKFRRPTVASDLDRTVAYRVTLQDDKFRRDLPRYLAQYKDMKNVFINKPRRPETGEVAQAARIDLKQHVEHIFIDEGQLIIVAHSPQHSMIELEDILWEFFQGGRGIMPQYTAERIPFIHYNLREFPDGMTVDYDGLLTWTPTPVQAGFHQIQLTVSDGYTRDEQVFQIYANYPPAIISQADTLALVEQRYTYRVRVDDKNEDAQLSYRLTKHPEGMKVDSKGVVTWIPSVEQINWQEFEIEVSDGHSHDRQATSLFVNMPPRIISQPKPVALNNFEYNYRLVAEDLNRDPIHYRATKLPRYSDFDPRTGLFKWRPRDIQKGPNDITFEITDSHGGVTVHEFQVHVFEDPSRRRFLFTGWPLMLAFVGVIFVLGIAVGG